MQKRILTITLNPGLERVIALDKFVPGKVNRAILAFQTAGGKGVNTSKALKILGVPVLASGLYGGITGILTTMEMLSREIDVDFVRTQTPTRYVYTIIETGKRRQTALTEPGMPVSRDELMDFKKKYEELLSESSLVVLSGTAPDGISKNIYAKLINLAHRAGAGVVLDTGGDYLRFALPAKPDAIKPNLQELESALGCRIKGIPGLKKAVTGLMQSGIKHVGVSLGKKGAVFGLDSRVWMAGMPDLKPVNVIGSGDCMTAGMAAALIGCNPAERGRVDAEGIIRLSMACAGANVLTPEPGSIRMEDVRKIYRKVAIKKI